jgi:hypothetical protein
MFFFSFAIPRHAAMDFAWKVGLMRENTCGIIEEQISLFTPSYFIFAFL